MLSIYLAGPEVFLPDAVEIGRQKQQLCARYGFNGLYPLDNEITPKAGERLDELIYQANKALMQRADFGICNLSPFRGPGADAGTVFELGLMTGMGKRVFAYTNDASDYAQRVAAAPSHGRAGVLARSLRPGDRGLRQLRQPDARMGRARKLRPSDRAA